MRGILGIGMAVLLFLPLSGLSAENAQAKIWCLSLRLQRGADQNNLTYLDLTSIPPAINGELAPNFSSSGKSHYSYLYLTDDLYGDETGILTLDIPSADDVDNDGFNDFFQVNQAVSGLTTSGAYQLSLYGEGTATARWNREAGSKDGSCVLTLNLNAFQKQIYTLPFELIEYSGLLSYIPASTNVQGQIQLLQTGNPDNVLQGPVQFIKVSTNRFNKMILQAGSWTNAQEQTWSFTKDLLSHDTNWTTNYFGYIDFVDGDPNSQDPDYLTWMLSINDPNDANHDNVPDLSDDPQIVPSRRPMLGLSLSRTNMVLSISGATNQVHEIQEITSISSTNWQTISSFTLTNDPQNVLLPLPDGTRFWRVRTR